MKRRAHKAAIALIGAGLLMGASMGTATARTLYSDDGISEVSVPDHWVVRPHLSLTASLRATDTRAEGNLVVNSYLPDEIKPQPLAKVADELSRSLLAGLEDAQRSPPRKLTLQGRPAIEHEVSGRMGNIRLSYLSTLIEGRTARHHVIAWPLAAGNQAARDSQREMVASFRESTKQRSVRERIDLAFKWPRTLESPIDFQGRKTRRGKTIEIGMSGNLRVRYLGENQLLVSTQINDFNLTSSDPNEARGNVMQNLVQQALSSIPDYVVSTDGAFVGVENLDNYLGRLEQTLLKTLPGDAGELQQKVKPLLKSLVSEDALTQGIQNEWNNQVANWAGGSYARGERYDYAAEYRAVALGNAVFPMTVTQRLLGRVPCNGDDKAKGCVMLEQVSRVSDPSFGKAMHAFVSQAVKDMAGKPASEANVSVDRAEWVKTLLMVAKPETLLPYGITRTEVTTLVVSNQGRSETTQDIEESITRYTY